MVEVPTIKPRATVRPAVTAVTADPPDPPEPPAPARPPRAVPEQKSVAIKVAPKVESQPKSQPKSPPKPEVAKTVPVRQSEPKPSQPDSQWMRDVFVGSK